MDKNNALNLAWAYVRYSTPAGSEVEGKVRPAIVLQSGTEFSTIFRCTSKDKSDRGFPTYALSDWKSYRLDKPTFVDLLYRYRISNSDIVRIVFKLTDRDMKGLLNALSSYDPKGEIDVSGKDKADTQKDKKGKPTDESVKFGKVQAGKESLRPFYEFIYDYLDSTMAFVFEDKADAFQDALEYYGFSGDLLADKLEHATDAEVRRFIVDHSIDTSPDNYYGNIKVLDSAIPEGDDPKAHAEAKGLLDDAFGLPIGKKPQKEEKKIAESADRKVVYEFPYDSVNPEDAEALCRHGLTPLGKSGKDRGVERFAVYGKEGDLRGYFSDSVGEIDGDALVDAEDFEADFYADGDLGNYAKAVLGIAEHAAEGHDAEGGECAGPKGFHTESGDDLYGCLLYLIKDEDEAVDGYDEAIKLFNSTSIPAPDREHIVRELQHIKDEELEHIRELKSLRTFVPKGIQGNSEEECEPTGAKDDESTDIEPATGTDAQPAEGGEGDGGH